MPLSEQLLAALPEDVGKWDMIVAQIDTEAYRRKTANFFDVEAEVRRIQAELQALVAKYPVGPQFDFGNIDPARRLARAAENLTAALDEMEAARNTFNQRLEIVS